MAEAFYFHGAIPASKSLLNRALIIQSFAPELQIIGDSQCDDVRHLRAALQSWSAAHPSLHCGAGGTTLRFLAARLAREPGDWTLTGDARLFERPHDPLWNALTSLGAQIQLDTTSNTPGLRITSSGWNVPDQPLAIETQQSSQFASAILLSAWNLPQALKLDIGTHIVSADYLNMTIEMLIAAGMDVNHNGNIITVPAGQVVNARQVTVEADLSSAFAIAALAAYAGEATLTNIPQTSTQPDFQGFAILEKMGAPLQRNHYTLHIAKAQQLRAIHCDLQTCPDLFPVLAILCAGASGESQLRGAPHLQHKESHRIHKVSELLSALEIDHTVHDDGLSIVGRPDHQCHTPISFDPDHDHRMVMAATLAQYQGHAVEIMRPDVVNKSFPEFRKFVRN